MASQSWLTEHVRYHFLKEFKEAGLYEPGLRNHNEIRFEINVYKTKQAFRRAITI